MNVEFRRKEIKGMRKRDLLHDQFDHSITKFPFFLSLEIVEFDDDGGERRGEESSCWFGSLLASLTLHSLSKTKMCFGFCLFLLLFKFVNANEEIQGKF